MTSRIKVTTTNFKVSKPGFDVVSATPDQLAFNALDFGYSGVHVAGVVDYDASWSRGSTPASVMRGYTAYRIYKDVPFGMTFSSPPLCLYSIRGTGITTDRARPRYSYGYNNTSLYAETSLGVCTFTDRVRFYIDTYRDPTIPVWIASPPHGLNYSFAYAVFYL